MRVLAVGGATLDIVNSVAAYPKEDDELRAISHHQSRGGNAANTLVVLSQLGHQCSWVGMLGDDAASRYIIDDLRRNGIDTERATVHPGGTTPTSYIISSRATGSRTIVHYRDLPEYSYTAFKKIDLGIYDWIHIEGREVSVCEKILRHAREVARSTTLSVEVEKPRKNIERLIGLADFVMFSKSYASAHGYRNAQQLFDAVRPFSISAMLFAAWGEAGAWLQGADGRSYHEPAFRPPAVVDTLGAGDVFNAGLIDALLAGNEPEAALNHAVHLAGEKCGRRGLRIA
ncbi:MAG: ketohexokinase [Candidatus Thiodiazotropha sp. (ex Ctena orbiculata)]|uniref:Ketohexokinase n=1 Tax=Candidatus Thiodiazotropha taylori TaxID=2792791 RepID=A0A944M5E9_9GAMM|nr:ketohexokinase [Candidatus Thiodiazotropha taylori]MBV2138277.1 ketohexokinase [Candidatus Thiodiazotropha taylori]MBV2139233.1 ketohexokinase [Candidatus Thiodiazotropha taylori]